MNRAERRRAGQAQAVRQGAPRTRGRIEFAIGERFRLRDVVLEVEKVERKRLTLKSVAWAGETKRVIPGMGPGSNRAEGVIRMDDREKSPDEVKAEAAEAAPFAPEESAQGAKDEVPAADTASETAEDGQEAADTAED